MLGAAAKLGKLPLRRFWVNSLHGTEGGVSQSAVARFEGGKTHINEMLCKKPAVGVGTVPVKPQSRNLLRHPQAHKLFGGAEKARQAVVAKQVSTQQRTVLSNASSPSRRLELFHQVVGYFRYVCDNRQRAASAFRVREGNIDLASACVQ